MDCYLATADAILSLFIGFCKSKSNSKSMLQLITTWIFFMWISANQHREHCFYISMLRYINNSYNMMISRILWILYITLIIFHSFTIRFFTETQQTNTVLRFDNQTMKLCLYCSGCSFYRFHFNSQYLNYLHAIKRQRGVDIERCLVAYHPINSSLYQAVYHEVTNFCSKTFML